MIDVNKQNRELGFPEIEMGIGLNEAEVVVGNIPVHPAAGNQRCL